MVTILTIICDPHHADLCTYLRLFRNLVNWRGYYTHKLVLMCLMLGFAWVFLPMNIVVQWYCRVIAWTFLGPWYVVMFLLVSTVRHRMYHNHSLSLYYSRQHRMKLVDILYIHPHYRTTEEILADPVVKDTPLANILTSESVRKMGTSARLASEEALKVR